MALILVFSFVCVNCVDFSTGVGECYGVVYVSVKCKRITETDKKERVVATLKRRITNTHAEEGSLPHAEFFRGGPHSNRSVLARLIKLQQTSKDKHKRDRK